MGLSPFKSCILEKFVTLLPQPSQPAVANFVFPAGVLFSIETALFKINSEFVKKKSPIFGKENTKYIDPYTKCNKYTIQSQPRHQYTN